MSPCTAVHLFGPRNIVHREQHFGSVPCSLEVLEERYARGEINQEKYLKKKRDILG
jgi:uncharacterized membrane protein